MDEKKRSVYITHMSENLTMLRSRLNVTQAQLAERIGVTRHTLLSAEKNKRPLTWMMFIALLTVFQRNTSTKALLKTLGIYDEELDGFLAFRAVDE